MKVLHIMSSFGGGISSFIKNKALALKESDIVFDVLTYDPVNEDFENAIKETGGSIYYMDNPKEHGLRQFYKQVDNVINNQPDNVIIHSHIQGYRMFPFYLIAKKNNVKRFIVHAHTDVDEVERKKLENKINRWINKSLKIERASCGIKASLNIFGNKLVQKNDIMHIPNSIDPEGFLESINKDKKKEEILGRVDSKELIIGNIARFHRQKNHQFMVEIIEELSKKNIKFTWLFIGDGALVNEIKKSIQDKELTKYVKFLGRRNDVNELYKIMDIFILPSLYEGLPTVAVEAQAAGTHIFMSDAITRETDLDMGLATYLPLNNKEAWINKICEFEQMNIDKMIRINKLKEKKFTNDTSAKLYISYLKGQCSHYEI